MAFSRGMTANQAGETFMDLSKLPKLSQTPPPPAPAEPDAATDSPRPVEFAPVQRASQTASGPEAFISIAIGLLLLWMASGLIRFLFNGDPGGITDERDLPMRYVDSVFFQSDLVIAVFAVALIVEGLVIALIRRPALILAAIALTVVAIVLNLAYVIKMQLAGYGLQILPTLAVIFGIYIAIYEWRMYQHSRALRTR
jgi:hypothetical protein